MRLNSGDFRFPFVMAIALSAAYIMYFQGNRGVWLQKLLLSLSTTIIEICLGCVVETS